MITPTWSVEIKEGVLVHPPGQVAKLAEWIGGLADGHCEMVIRKPKQSGTGQQFRYLNGVVYKIVGETLGLSRDAVDVMYCAMFLSEPQRNGPDRIRTTSDLNIYEMGFYWDKIRAHAKNGFPHPETGKGWPELKIKIPKPEKVDV